VVGELLLLCLPEVNLFSVRTESDGEGGCCSGFHRQDSEAGMSVCSLLSSLEAVSQGMDSVGLRNMPVENLVPLLPSQCSRQSRAWNTGLLSSLLSSVFSKLRPWPEGFFCSITNRHRQNPGKYCFNPSEENKYFSKQ